jgi:hypothetical protein
LEASLGKKNFWSPHLTRKKLGMVGCACHPSYGGKLKMGGMAQVTEHLPSKQIALYCQIKKIHKGKRRKKGSPKKECSVLTE